MTCIRPSLRGAEPPEPWQSQPDPRPQPRPQRAGRILIAEDDEDVRYILMRSLTEAGFDVLAAEDGQAALNALKNSDDLDLLITDIRMPRMSGYALAAHLRAAHPDLPVIYVTGYSAGWERAVEEFGPNSAFLQKPYTEQDLIRTIEELLH